MKMFAVIENNIVINGWFAESFKEAQQDNPEKTIVELTLNNSPAYLHGYWDGKKFYERNSNA